MLTHLKKVVKNYTQKALLILVNTDHLVLMMIGLVETLKQVGEQDRCNEGVSRE